MQSLNRAKLPISEYRKYSSNKLNCKLGLMHQNKNEIYLYRDLTITLQRVHICT